MTTAEKVAELRTVLEREHLRAAFAPTLEDRAPHDAIANETARAIVLLLTDAKGRRRPVR